MPEWSDFANGKWNLGESSAKVRFMLHCDDGGNKRTYNLSVNWKRDRRAAQQRHARSVIANQVEHVKEYVSYLRYLYYVILTVMKISIPVFSHLDALFICMIQFYTNSYLYINFHWSNETFLQFYNIIVRLIEPDTYYIEQKLY